MSKCITILMACVSFLDVTAQKTEKANINHRNKMDNIVSFSQHDTINIAVLIYPNVTLLDFTVPIEVLSKAKNLTKGKYHTFTVSFDKDPIITENGLFKVTPDYTIPSVHTPVA